MQLDKTQRMHKACVDVKNKEVWNGLYVLCGLCHGPLLVIRYSDAVEPAMDKVFYWSYMTCVYIKQNEDKINAVSFFSEGGAIEEDGNFEEELRMFFSDSERRYGAYDGLFSYSSLLTLI